MSRRRTVRVARSWRETPFAKVVEPIQDFVGRSTSSGIVLLVATVLALLCANIPAIAPTYFGILDTHIGITVGSMVLDESVLHWINDGLMALFFLLVGLLAGLLYRGYRAGTMGGMFGMLLYPVFFVGLLELPRYVLEIFEQIVKVNKAGVGILMVEQNARQALAFASRGFVLATGKNRFTGTGPELIADPEVAKSFLGG